MSSKEEKDPSGIDQHAPGAKLDLGKPEIGLLFESFPNALAEVARVASFGADKYSRGGWKHVANGEQRYRDARGRHILKEYSEGSIDSDSGLPHEAHVAWNSLAVLELILTKTS